MKYVLFVLLQLFAINIFAQAPMTTRSYTEFQLLEHVFQQKSTGDLSEDNIEGSPYLNKEYEIGEVLTEKHVRYVNVPLRYNIYSNEIEFKNAKGQTLSIDFPGNIKEVKIGHAVFVYRLYSFSHKKLSAGYFQLMNRGKVEGLIHYRVIFKAAEPALAYKEARPPTFEQKPAYYFVSIQKKPAVQVKNLKALITLLGNHKKELEAFARKEKIKVRRKNDLMRLLQYYNSIQ